MPKKSSVTPRFADLSQQLDELLAKLQSEETDIDEALELYKEGTELVREMQQRLTAADIKVKELKIS